jgi:CBS domain-containing protein
VSVEEMARIMARRDLENFPVTTSDGRLVGLVRREDVDAVEHRVDAG